MSATKGELSLLEVAADHVAGLDQFELHALMARLFSAEAAIVGLPSTDALVCTDTSITDGGQDGRTEAHNGDSTYLPGVATCWQFKAGTKGAPAALKGEVRKPIPSAILEAGGAYVVVTSEAKGPSLAKRRHDVLIAEAKKAKLPTKMIRVIEAEMLARWCTERLGVALYVLGMSPHCLTPASWRNGSKLLSGPYVEDDRLRRELTQVRAALDPAGGAVLHAHVEGLPGVGKTRFALEVIEGASWKELAVCFDGADNAKAIELIASLGLDPRRRGVIVVDEAHPNEVEKLNAAVQRCEGRVRLLTIGGHRPAPGSESVVIRMPRLNDVDVAKVIAASHERLTREQVDFCAHQARGYVKFADVLADLVERNPGIEPADIFDDDNVSASLTRLLDGIDGVRRRALSVIALFSGIGWKDGAESELKLVATHFGLKVADFRQAAEAAQKRFGICPAAGSRRYVSPEPLANYLATEAWQSEEEAVLKLPALLAGTEALDAFYARLRRLAAFPAAKAFAQRELDRFFDLTTLNDERAARVWSIVSAADPVRAVANLREALDAPGADVLGLDGRQRREIVWALERLAWPRASFPDAMRCLSRLALAENESYANNATGIFLQRFMPVLGGSEVPFMERLAILDELLEVKSVQTQGLVVKALESALTTSGYRMGIEEIEGRPLPPEWQPTRIELMECHRVAIARIRQLVEDGLAELQSELFRAFRDNFWPMNHEGLFEEMAGLARALVSRFPHSREDVRRVVESTNALLEPSGREAALQRRLKALEAEFADLTFAGRLRKFVGAPAYFVHEPTEDIRALAREAFASPMLLDENRDWLRSNDARGGSLFGAALAEMDTDERLLGPLATIAGRGEAGPMFSGYVLRRARNHDSGWLEDLLDHLADGTPEEEELAVDVMQRAPGTRHGAERLARMVARGRVPESRFASLAFGRWALDVPVEALAALVSAFPRREPFSEAGATMLGARVNRDPDSAKMLEALLLDYAMRPEVIRGRGHVDYQWTQIATAVLPAHARQLAAAIFACQLPHEGWFIEHSGAANVLNQCVDADSAGVWQALAPHLARDDAALFVIGFPDFVVPRMPVHDVLEWIAADADHRGVAIARLLPGIGDDSTLGAVIADRFANNRSVADALYGSLISGAFWGPASERWKSKAVAMDKVASSTKLEGLRRWARHAAESLRRMAAEERDREAEEDLRR